MIQMGKRRRSSRRRSRMSKQAIKIGHILKSDGGQTNMTHDQASVVTETGGLEFESESMSSRATAIAMANSNSNNNYNYNYNQQGRSNVRIMSKSSSSVNVRVVAIENRDRLSTGETAGNGEDVSESNSDENVLVTGGKVGGESAMNPADAAMDVNFDEVATRKGEKSIFEEDDYYKYVNSNNANINSIGEK